MFICTDNQRLKTLGISILIVRGNLRMLFKIDFSWFPGDQSGDQWLPTEFQGRGGGKENRLREYLKHGRFLPVFRGKIKVGEQSSSTECKGRLLKTDTLLRRERVIRMLQSLMGDNVLTQPKSSDPPFPTGDEK